MAAQKATATKKAPKKKAAGRPGQLNTATRKRVIKLMLDGVSLTMAASKLKICRATLYNWLNNDKEFGEAVRGAREFAAMGLMDEVLDIADDDSKDLIVNDFGDKKPNAVAVNRASLRIKARQNLGKYYNPQLFGDKSAVDITSNGESVFQGLCITPPKSDD